MRNLILIFLISIFWTYGYGQKPNFTYNGFEQQIIKFTPQKRDRVSQEKFNYANMILKETKEATKNDPANFNLADYFNILFAFLNLDVDDDDLNIAYKKFVSTSGSCEYLISFKNKVKENQIYDRIRARYMIDLQKCEKTVTYKTNMNTDVKLNSGSAQLISLMDKVNAKDQKFRSIDSTLKNWVIKQKPLDIENQKSIDSLFNVYGTYIGKSMVGQKFQSVMWIVIQHSDIGRMEKYLPYIEKAVQLNELPAANLKMLIDRIYAIKYKYQIFGSQVDTKLANEEIIRSVKLQYKLN